MRKWIISVTAVALSGLLWVSMTVGQSDQAVDPDLAACTPASAFGMGTFPLDMRSIFRGLPMNTSEPRIDAMLADIDGLFAERFGLVLSGTERAHWWFGEDTWSMCLVGTFDGSPSGLHTRQIAGQTAAEIEHDVYLARSGNVVVLGNEHGLEQSLFALDGTVTSAVAGNNGAASLLAEILPRVGESGMALAIDATSAELDGMPGMAGLQRIGVGFSEDALLAVFRYSGAAEASAAQSQVEFMIQMGLANVDAQATQARTSDNFGDALGSLLTNHAAHIFIEDTLSISVAGTDLTATLPLATDQQLLVVTVGILASVSIPAFLRYIKRSKTTEATMNVRRMYDAAVSYYSEDRTTATGEILPPQFPSSVAMTPSVVPCGVKAAPVAGQWGGPTWEALNFAIQEPHYYSYQFDSSGVGAEATFTATAFGNLDCDDEYATFVRVGSIVLGEVRGGAGLYQMNELE